MEATAHQPHDHHAPLPTSGRALSGAAAGEDGPIAVATEFPTDGRYRLFLQFQVDGEVQTAAFTREVRR